MRSTGEVMGISDSFGSAFAKAQLAASNGLPASGCILITVTDSDKPAVTAIARRFRDSFRRRVLPVEPVARSVAVQSVAHVVALLEVVGERQRQERAAGDDEFHRGGETLLHHGNIAGGQVAPELVHVAEHL